MPICPSCQKDISGEYDNCPHCGAYVQEEFNNIEFRPLYHCPRCKTSDIITEGDVYITCQICSLTFDKQLFGRIPDSRILAREELKELLDSPKKLNYDQTMILIHYCQFYQEELNSTNNLEFIYDIQPLITRLLKQGEYPDSDWIQSHTYLLQGQLALLEMNMGEARRNITRAQEIAEDQGLTLLARKISYEHDKLLGELDKWEKLKKQKAPISERLSLVHLNETINSMQRKRKIEVPESIEEKSMLLLILAEGGILLFSYAFSDELKFDEELFGGFLTAFNYLHDEIFSEGLDRVKFGKHTVLLEPVANFTVCYLFKGETYRAKQKVSKFAESLKKNPSLQLTLDKFLKSSRVLELKDSPSLQNMISDIFLS